LGDLRLELLVKRNPMFTSVLSTDPHVLVVRSQRSFEENMKPRDIETLVTITLADLEYY